MNLIPQSKTLLRLTEDFADVVITLYGVVEFVVPLFFVFHATVSLSTVIITLLDIFN